MTFKYIYIIYYGDKMKFSLKSLINTLLLIFLFISIILGCSTSDKPTNPNQNQNVPKITNINPDSAKIGDIVIIYGSSFQSVQNSSFVLFNNIKAIEYISWADTQIKVKVPSGATSGKVSVTVNGVKSNELDFTITNNIEYGTLTDIDGNKYKTVKIGNQWWMAENLSVSHYRDGTSIPKVTEETQWANLTTGAWCYYNNDSDLGIIYGKLYNWYAVNDSRGLAPAGWHIPSDAEWTILTNIDFHGNFISNQNNNINIIIICKILQYQ
jgi:hypothetical protein